jgi:hypothetical protein
MRNFTTKIDAPNPGNNGFSADEANNLFTENENAVLASGLTLDNSGVDVNQLALAISRHAQGARYFVDSGSANSKILTKQNSFRPVSSYFAGMEVYFYVAASNTGATTINIDGAGSVAIKNEFGNTLGLNDLTKGNLVTLIYDGTNFRIKDRGINYPWLTSSSPRNFVMSNASGDTAHDINLSPGCVFAENGKTFIYSDNDLVKRIDSSWSAGTSQGGRFSSVTLSPNSTYHFFVIRQDSTGIVDAGFDSSLVAANRPSGWTHYARVGSVITDASTNIINFTQYGRYFMYKTPFRYADTSFTLVAKSLTLNVPTGIKVGAKLTCSYITGAGGTTAIYLSSYDNDNTLPGISEGEAFTVIGGSANSASDGNGEAEIVTNTDGQIRYRSNRQSGGGANQIAGGMYFILHGYIDEI